MATEDDSDIPETGAIFTFGKSKFGDNSPCKFWLKNDHVSRVCCGDEHTALVTDNGRIFMFGSNEWGQLGLGHNKTVTKPTRIKDKILKEEKVKLIACGRHHTILATEGGKLFSFGSNTDGQLGLGTEDSQPVTNPQYVEALRVRNFKMLSCGAEHSAALTEDGKLYVWGGGSEGQLGLGDTTETAEPTLLPFDETIVCVACGYYHTAFVTESGKLYTFGETDCGKLGQGEDPPNHQEAHVVHGISSCIVSVACGGSHTVAITASGSVYTFGDGSNGQLGHGTTILVADTPQELTWGKNIKVTSASCGENSTSLISDKGQLYTFGDGRHGKLALGEENFANQFTPSLVPRFANFTVQKVSCGGCHMLAVAKVRAENGVKENWEDSEDECDADVSNLESSMRKSGDLSGGSLELSGTIARNRRREKLPDTRGTMNRTLPPLNGSMRGLPPLGQTQPLADDTLSKKTLPQIHKVEVPKLKSAKSMDNKHKGDRKKEDSEEEESSEVSVTEESSEEEEEKKKPTLSRETMSERVPQPKPRAMPRKKAKEDSPVESDEDDDDDETEESEEEKTDRKKHSQKEEEKKDEVDQAKVRPKPASRKMTKERQKSEDSEECSDNEETEEEEDVDSEEDVRKKKLSKKKAAEEERKRKKAEKTEKEKKKKQKQISVFGRKKMPQASDSNDSSDDDDNDEEEEEEEEKHKKSKGAKDKIDKKKKKKDKSKKSDENSEDEDEEEDEDEAENSKKKIKETKNKKGKKKEADSEEKEDDDGSEEEDEKKSEGVKEVEEKPSKTCAIL